MDPGLYVLPGVEAHPGPFAGKLGLQRVFYPEEPSMDGFLDAVMQALNQQQQ
jgi:hypothetical protein